MSEDDIWELPLVKLQKAGYNPIALSEMTCEDVFVFETAEEAKKAYHEFERSEDGIWKGDIAGWWYGRENFLKEVEWYEKKFETKVLIQWL